MSGGKIIPIIVAGDRANEAAVRGLAVDQQISNGDTLAKLGRLRSEVAELALSVANLRTLIEPPRGGGMIDHWPEALKIMREHLDGIRSVDRSELDQAIGSLLNRVAELEQKTTILAVAIARIDEVVDGLTEETAPASH